MRVLEILTNIVDFNPFLLELCIALKEKGVDVHCACSLNDLWGSRQETDGSPARMHDIPFARGLNPLNHMFAAHRLNALVSRIRPDIVHVHISAAIFTAALARRRYWPVTIGTFHGVNFPNMNGLKARLLRIAESWAAEMMDEAWVINTEDHKSLGLFASNAKVLKLRSFGIGCNLDRFSPNRFSTSDLNSIRTQLGFLKENRVFTFVGRFTKHKGFDVTARAFLAMAEHDPNVRLLLIGDYDPIHPSGLTPDEEEALKTSSQVVDVGWQTEVEKFLAIAHVMVFPSLREGMPVCLMEALAMGIPVITTNTRGCRDVVRDQVDGFVLGDHSVDTLIGAMKFLAENERLRSKLAEEAYAGRERFDRQDFISEQIETYERLLGTPIGASI